LSFCDAEALSASMYRALGDFSRQVIIRITHTRARERERVCCLIREIGHESIIAIGTRTGVGDRTDCTPQWSCEFPLRTALPSAASPRSCLRPALVPTAIRTFIVFSIFHADRLIN
jgi:hypothetical protein